MKITSMLDFAEVRRLHGGGELRPAAPPAGLRHGHHAGGGSGAEGDGHCRADGGAGVVESGGARSVVAADRGLCRAFVSWLDVVVGHSLPDRRNRGRGGRIINRSKRKMGVYVRHRAPPARGGSRDDPRGVGWTCDGSGAAGDERGTSFSRRPRHRRVGGGDPRRGFQVPIEAGSGARAIRGRWKW